MSESQFPRSQFSHFTEEEYDKWVEAGKPFEQHNELLVYLDQKLENGSLDDLYSFYYYYIFMYIFG
ncbi:hypothetical protein RirG_110250 [Rhizophagus irregularis DAOM 197198w]|uniref:Uncharacterized protein n=1 Tax=Rhizophagus irregularis (strain DAOM 197198w) TaxID=1432141 RepID=A0A015JEI8_RHIIW|nr:hypothetical protein RirG_110250 [Rhizophagus irregularis DAOM 197198w]